MITDTIYKQMKMKTSVLQRNDFFGKLPYNCLIELAFHVDVEEKQFG